MKVFASVNQTNSVPYDKRFIGQQPPSRSFYSAQPYYPTSYYSNGRYPLSSYSQLAQYGMNSASFMHPIDRQYQYQQRWNHLNEMQKSYWQQQTDAMALSMYARPFPVNYTTGTIYPFWAQTQFINYPNLDSFGARQHSPRRGLGYNRPAKLVHPNWAPVNIVNAGNIRQLPPKIRVVFVPSGPMLVPQPCASPLCMPPFLFNRIAQPLYSLPLPPPLPQVASLCLENDVQQILMQRSANPVAILPFNTNWQIPQPMMSSYPQVPQLQQQPIIHIPTSYSYQPALIPDNVPLFPSQIPPSLDVVSQAPQMPQYYNSDYPSACRACIPQPPLFNNSPANNSWMQYCWACHHIPAPTTNPNIRPTNGRITPLFSRSTALPTGLNQARSPYQNPDLNASNSMDYWLRKTPPLPPGAILIFDEYLNKTNPSQEHQFQKKTRKSLRRTKKPIRKSITINTNDIHWITPREKQSSSEITATGSDIRSRQSFGNSKSAASTRSLYSTSINDSINRAKTITGSTEKSDNISQVQPPTEVSDFNPRNSTLTQDTKSQLSSNEEKLKSSSNSDVLRNLRLSLAMRDNQFNPPSTAGNSSTKEEGVEEKQEGKTTASTHAPSSLQSESKYTKTESMIEHENIRQTPSTLRSNSRITLASNPDTNFDSVSQINVDKHFEGNLSSTDTF